MGHIVALAVRIPHFIVLFLGTWLPFNFFGVNIPFREALVYIPVLMVLVTLPASGGPRRASQAHERCGGARRVRIARHDPSAAALR